MFTFLATMPPTLSTTTPSPQFSPESLYATGTTITLVGIGTVLMNLLILMLVISISKRVIERFARHDDQGKAP